MSGLEVSRLPSVAPTSTASPRTPTFIMSEATQQLEAHEQSSRRWTSTHKIQIIAAVSAVVSAFHSGSEIFKVVKKKRRAARKDQELVQQEWEEEQLQSSLLAGEKQISLRYERDQRELGDL